MPRIVAAEQMYQLYKSTKSNLPANINSQRDFIIDSLCRGEEIAGVFVIATQNAEAAANQLWPKPKKHKK